MDKPGYKSTEFWLSLVAIIIGAVMSSGILDETATPWDNKIAGMIAAVLAALGYTVARSFVKGSALKADAIKAVKDPS